MMYLTFWLVFTVANTRWLDRTGIGFLAAVSTKPGRRTMANPAIAPLDGIIAASAASSCFLPNIMLLFLPWPCWKTPATWPARFIMDRMMKWVGLHGKSLPHVTARPFVPESWDRVLDNQRDRLTTMLVCRDELRGTPDHLHANYPAFFSGPQAAWSCTPSISSASW